MIISLQSLKIYNVNSINSTLDQKHGWIRHFVWVLHITNTEICWWSNGFFSHQRSRFLIGLGFDQNIMKCYFCSIFNVCSPNDFLRLPIFILWWKLLVTLNVQIIVEGRRGPIQEIDIIPTVGCPQVYCWAKTIWQSLLVQNFPLKKMRSVTFIIGLFQL